MNLFLVITWLVYSATSLEVQGCSAYRCISGATGVSSLALPATPPTATFFHPLTPLSPNGRFSTPGCISNVNTLLCYAPLSNGTIDNTVSGAIAINITNFNPLYLYKHPFSPLDTCTSDLSFQGVPSNLGVMAVDGEVIVYGTGSVSRLSSNGTTEWSQTVEGQTCPSILSSVALTNASTLSFFRDGGVIFSYYNDGVPNAALTLRANSSASPSPNEIGNSSGLLLPILQVGAPGTLRTLYLTRFYACEGGYCGDDYQLRPTPELRLVAMDTNHHGVPPPLHHPSSGTTINPSGDGNTGGGVRGGAVETPSPTTLGGSTSYDPRRMILPWKDLGPPILAHPQPLDLAACLPDTLTGRERLALSAMVLPGDITLVASLYCRGSPTLHLTAFSIGVGGNQPQGVELWRREIPSLGAPPSPLLFGAGDGGGGGGGEDTVWVFTGVGEGGGGGVTITSLCPLTGETVWSTPLDALLPTLATTTTTATTITTSNCPISPGYLVSHLHAPPIASSSPTLLLLPTTLSDGSPWMVALRSAGNATHVQWCHPLVSPYQGQFVLATKMEGGQEGDSVIIGMTEAGVVGLHWE